MKGKFLLLLPLVAFLCGEKMEVPSQLAPLPTISSCQNHEAAKKLYLLAYAHKENARDQALSLATRAQRLLTDCEPGMLQERISQLLKVVSLSIKNSRRLNP